jgi:hypothetical protein
MLVFYGVYNRNDKEMTFMLSDVNQTLFYIFYADPQPAIFVFFSCDSM